MLSHWAWGAAFRFSLSVPSLLLVVALAVLGGFGNAYVGWGGTVAAALLVARAGLRGETTFPGWKVLAADGRALARALPHGLLVATVLLSPLLLVLVVGAAQDVRELVGGSFFLMANLAILFPLGLSFLPPCLLLVADGGSALDALTPVAFRRDLASLGSDRAGMRLAFVMMLAALMVAKALLAGVPVAGPALGRLPIAWLHLVTAHLWGYALSRSQSRSVSISWPPEPARP